jgi:hypothetical protein
MVAVAWIGLLLLTAGCLLWLAYHLKRDHARPTLHHALFASHLYNRPLFRGTRWR